MLIFQSFSFTEPKVLEAFSHKCSYNSLIGGQDTIKKQSLELGLFNWTISEVDMGPEQYGAA